MVLDVRRRRDLAAQLITDAGVDYSSVLSSKSVSTGQFLCPLLEPILYLVTACERCMGGNLTQLGLLLGIPLELPREDLMDIAEDYNETDREVSFIFVSSCNISSNFISICVDNLCINLLWRNLAAFSPQHFHLR